MRSVEVQPTSQHCQSLGQDPAVQPLGHEVLIQSVQLETEEVDESHPAFLTLVPSSSERKTSRGSFQWSLIIKSSKMFSSSNLVAVMYYAELQSNWQHVDGACRSHNVGRRLQGSQRGRCLQGSQRGPSPAGDPHLPASFTSARLLISLCLIEPNIYL